MNVPDAMVLLVGVAALGYLLGSVPFGLLLTRAAGLGDIRRVGSGSIGATNVLRTGRWGLAAATLLLDAAKGAVAALAGQWLLGLDGVLVGGLAAMLGHLFPVWLGFRGGKGVATGLGVLAAADWRLALIAGGIWLAVAFLLRFSSAAALAACAAAPIVAAMLHEPFPTFGLAAVGAVLVVARHHSNIRRLLSGTEPKIGAKR